MDLLEGPFVEYQLEYSRPYPNEGIHGQAAYFILQEPFLKQ